MPVICTTRCASCTPPPIDGGLREPAGELKANEAKVWTCWALVQLGEIEYAEGPPGRNSQAKCYRAAGGEPSLLANPGSPANLLGNGRVSRVSRLL